MTSKKIVIIVPRGDGGVSSFYTTLSPYLAKSNVKIFYNSKTSHIFILKILFRIWDLIRFIIALLFKNYDIVLINPSLGVFSVIRDWFYCYISAILFHKTIVLHWHGWRKNCEDIISSNRLNISIFKYAFFRADKMIVLSNDICQTLKKWGYDKRIYLSTTAVDDKSFMIERNYLEKDQYKILFLSRIEKEKGVFLAIDAYRYCKNIFHQNVSLIVAGDGSSLKKVVDICNNELIGDVSFCGYVTGNDKINTFLNADIFLFTSYSEGMPSALLEAMSFGLPVITTSVGGIKDFFVNEKMGFIIDSFEPILIAEKIRSLVNNFQLLSECSKFNRTFAKENFMASMVAKKLVNYILE